MANRAPARTDVLQGTLDLMVLQTLATLGPLHGYAIAARLEQVSIASAVGRRRREIGIRLALGAGPGAAVQMIVRDVAGMVFAGLGVGVLASVVAGEAAARGVLGPMLFELSPSVRQD